MIERELEIRTAHGQLTGRLAVPLPACGLVVQIGLPPPAEPEGIGAGGRRPWATLSLALLTPEEARYPDNPHNVPLLTQRLLAACETLQRDGDTGDLPIALFADAHAAPAAIRAAARRDRQVRALACHGGLIDLAGVQHLDLLSAPLLILVDADDDAATASFRRAACHLKTGHELHRLAPGENPAGRAVAWFDAHLQAV